jgi:hypothetical protein
VEARFHDLRHSAGRRSCSALSLADTPGGVPADIGPPYFAIVARTTAQLKMKPVIITNLDTS